MKKKKIIEAINKLPKELFANEPDGVSLIEGIINTPLIKTIDAVPDRNLPTIAVVGNNTGMLYYFSYKALIGDEKL